MRFVSNKISSDMKHRLTATFATRLTNASKCHAIPVVLIVLGQIEFVPIKCFCIGGCGIIFGEGGKVM